MPNRSSAFSVDGTLAEGGDARATGLSHRPAASSDGDGVQVLPPGEAGKDYNAR